MTIKLGDYVKLKVKLGGNWGDFPKIGEVVKIVEADLVPRLKGYKEYIAYDNYKECFMFEGYPRSHFLKKYLTDDTANKWFEKVEVPMLKQEDIKEGAVLICIDDNNGIMPGKFTINKAYKVNKGYLIDDDCGVGRIIYGYSYNRLHMFKLKPKEHSIMIEHEIYAVGTLHKSVNGKNEYRIIQRDIKNDSIPHVMMMVQSRKGYLSLRDQLTGKQLNSEDNESCDLMVSKKKIKGWINVYYESSCNKHQASTLWHTKQNADSVCAPDRIACIEVEFEEGEGLQ